MPANKGARVRTPATQVQNSAPANGLEIGQTQHSGAGPGTPVPQPQDEEFVHQMTPADQLARDASGRPRAAAQGIAGQQAAGNAGLNSLQNQILGSTTPGNSVAQNLAKAGPVGSAYPINAPLSQSGVRPVSGVPNAPAGAMPTGVYNRPAPNALAAGVGQGSIDEVDAALTGYDPRFNVPGNVQRGALPGTGTTGALPGTVQGGALPGNAQMGALPGATDRGLQTSALDRVLGFNANTASLAEAQLADAGQMNLSNSLAMARSARGGPAAQAQALRMAQAEGAATMSQQARDLAMLRAKEEDTAKARELEALGLGGELSSSIRGSDVLERQQNVGAITDALNADVTQRGQTVQSLDNALNAGVTQRGQTIESLMNERNAGVTERGQTVSSLDNALNAGVTQRGQTIDANQSMSRNELDALLGRSGLAQSERQAGVQERGQTLDAVLGTENTKVARDQIAASSLTDAEKTEAQVLIARAQLGYQLTPEEQVRTSVMMQKMINEGNDPTALQYIFGGVQAAASTAQAAAAVGGAGA